jgi:hypothetical protein
MRKVSRRAVRLVGGMREKPGSLEYVRVRRSGRRRPGAFDVTTLINGLRCILQSLTKAP